MSDHAKLVAGLRKMFARAAERPTGAAKPHFEALRDNVNIRLDALPQDMPASEVFLACAEEVTVAMKGLELSKEGREAVSGLEISLGMLASAEYPLFALEMMNLTAETAAPPPANSAAMAIKCLFADAILHASDASRPAFDKLARDIAAAITGIDPRDMPRLGEACIKVMSQSANDIAAVATRDEKADDLYGDLLLCLFGLRTGALPLNSEAVAGGYTTMRAAMQQPAPVSPSGGRLGDKQGRVAARVVIGRESLDADQELRLKATRRPKPGAPS